MTRRGDRRRIPEPVREILQELRAGFQVDLHLWLDEGGGRRVYVFPDGKAPPAEDPVLHSELTVRDGPTVGFEIRGDEERARLLGSVLPGVLERIYDLTQEVRFFTYELSERYEEINLLYSISEILGSILSLDEAARIILGEVCDVLGARRGSLWVYRREAELLDLVASVGEEGLSGPIGTDDPHAVTARVFREGRSVIVTREDMSQDASMGRDYEQAGEDSFLSVPIRYTPPTGEAPRTVGVINLIGHRRHERFTASDQKLLSAIASQVGAALENNRLIRESLARERMGREMELAHNLQQKLLVPLASDDGVQLGARVEPAEQVGGDFYHLLRLPEGRMGIMIGDVSTHGFPAALIMALSMSAATIYAAEVGTPAAVLRHVDDALRDELEATDMYLSLFYAVLDQGRGELVYSNAGHPHAFVIRPDGEIRRLEATDPPVGFAGPDAYRQRQAPWEERDLLLLFTDGLSDILASERRVSGEEVVLAEAVKLRDRAPAEIVEGLFALARDANPTMPSDDRTAVVLRA